MTDNQLSKLGIIKDGGKIHPKRYFCNTIGAHLKLTGKEDGEDILDLIYERAYEDGILEGKITRSEEIKLLLNIKP